MMLISYPPGFHSTQIGVALCIDFSGLLGKFKLKNKFVNLGSRTQELLLSSIADIN